MVNAEKSMHSDRSMELRVGGMQAKRENRSNRRDSISPPRSAPGTPRHQVDALMLRTISTPFHHGLDFHVDAPSLAPTHGVEMELA